ncbi:hypothetical protein [Actinacidiphila reveromycinica]|uniref:hypothetical protein n=1 Tax=Actinacidiphila reveromycinica TaxID=659352 RepID=UPI001F48243F|nr:hypothetical protein [Streptomyces sp. SN-593]
MAVIAALAFVFSFGNVWALALRLGVPYPITPLIAPWSTCPSSGSWSPCASSLCAAPPRRS